MAKQFAVGASAVIKLMKRHRDHGTIAARKAGTGCCPDLEPHCDLIRTLAAVKPDVTIDELQRQLADAGVHSSRSPLGRRLLHLGLARKKGSTTPRSRTGPTSPRPAKPGGPVSLASVRGD